MKKLILGLVVLGALGGGGYYCYDHFTGPETEQKESTESAIEAGPEAEAPARVEEEAPPAEESR